MLPKYVEGTVGCLDTTSSVLLHVLFHEQIIIPWVMPLHSTTQLLSLPVRIPFPLVLCKQHRKE